MYYSDRHAAKVSLFMLDLMTPLISEADGVSQPLLEIILGQILEPHKVILYLYLYFLFCLLCCPRE